MNDIKTKMTTIKINWTKNEISDVYNTPLLELIYNAATIHRQHHKAKNIKPSTLISFKTGACQEDCSYCSQSTHYKTFVDKPERMSIDEVVASATQVKNNGVNRVCLSASWRKIPENSEFDDLITMIQKVKSLEMEVCCTLGMLTQQQAERLAQVGISSYNHNIDTSENYYEKIITTRTYKDRLRTIEILINAGIPVCSGGIIGLGESVEDRISMIHTLATLKKHPSTVPINSLIPIEGTPLEKNKSVSVWEIIRMIATVRITMPATMIELAAGRKNISDEGQSLCFMAGVNSIFVGTKLLTTPNPEVNDDTELMKILGLNLTEKLN